MSLDPLDTVRVGIIGPSWWVDFWHLPALLHHPDVIITAVCGTQDRTADEIKIKYGEKAKYFTDLDTMLDTALLDGVVVCTPNNVHHPATMAALRRGLHVTCEKPMALTSDEALEMYTTARDKGLIGMINFPYRDNPAVKELKSKLAEGYVGTPFHISGSYHGGFGLGEKRGWRGYRTTSGAGILGDLGSHLIDLARYVLDDEFASVCAHTMTALKSQNDAKTPVPSRTENKEVGDLNDDSCTFLAEFDKGTQGIFHTSWLAYQGAYGQQQELEIYGSEGRLHFLANHSGTFLRGMRRGEQKWEWFPIAGIVPPEDAREENEDHFRPGRLTPTNTTFRWIEAIKNNDRRLTPSFEDGWRTQLVIDAVLVSSAKRRWISISTSDDKSDDDDSEPHTEEDAEYTVFD